MAPNNGCSLGRFFARTLSFVEPQGAISLYNIVARLTGTSDGEAVLLGARMVLGGDLFKPPQRAVISGASGRALGL